MSLHVPEQRGLRISGTAAVFPTDLTKDGIKGEGCGVGGGGRVLSNEDVFRVMLGKSFQVFLAKKGWSLEYPHDQWGVARREWLNSATRRAPSELAARKESPDGAARKERLDGVARLETPDGAVQLETPNGAGAGQAEPANAGDLAVAAARAALDDAGLSPQEVGLLITATSTPPRITSSLASLVGKKVGITAPCIDLRGGGAGGLQAWMTAIAFVARGCPSALIVATESPSLYLNPDDIGGALLYGDGAGAVVLTAGAGEGGLIGGLMGNETLGGRPFTVPGPLPPTREALEGGLYFFQSPDRQYLEGLSGVWQSAASSLRTRFPEAQHIRWFIPYAVTLPQVRAAAEALQVPEHRTFHTLEQYGCLGCAGPLVSLHVLRRQHGLRDGDILAFCAVGGGVSWAAFLWEVTEGEMTS